MKNLSKNYRAPSLDGPLLDKVKVNFPSSLDFTQYPFSLPLVKNLQDIAFPTPVTFFVGENGTGKSTILEALAYKAGFGAEGGSKNIHFKTAEEKTYAGVQKLAEYFILSWRFKPQNGYFFRAESFFNIANYLDYLARECGGGEKAYAPYGGKSLHLQSHGESFLSFFQNRLGNEGFFVLDEPEAALSPQRQLSLLTIIHEMCKSSFQAQFIIATHSPILLAYPDATIYSCDSDTLATIVYTDTSHYQITKNFLNNPDGYMQYLFKE
jgi:predicted ATPase